MEAQDNNIYVNKNAHVSVGTWIGIFLINCIPIIGTLIYLIMLFVWAFGGTDKISLKNYAKATLLLITIGIAIGIIGGVIAIILGASKQ